MAVKTFSPLWLRDIGIKHSSADPRVTEKQVQVAVVNAYYAFPSAGGGGGATHVAKRNSDYVICMLSIDPHPRRHNICLLYSTNNRKDIVTLQRSVVISYQQQMNVFLRSSNDSSCVEESGGAFEDLDKAFM